MATQIFMNLAVKDLNRSKDFFTRIGYSFNEKFTNESGACMVISNDIYAMLLTEPFFKGFLPHKDIADTTRTSEVLMALSVDSREQVDEYIEKALAAGGTLFREAQDHGFMYAQAYQDLDGHIWEIFWMDPAAAE